MLRSLQAGRALAALAVVLHHSNASVMARGCDIPAILVQILEKGWLGVDFFFVLSGFILVETNLDKIGKPEWTKRYTETRLTRIFIPYIPVGVGMGVAYVLLPELSGAPRDWSWFATLTLLPTDRDTALSVAWTLRSELVFYALFWLAFAIRRPVAILAVWGALIVMLAVANVPLSLGWSFVLGVLNLEFLFGMLIGVAARRPDIMQRISDVTLVMLAGAAAALFAFQGADRPHSYLFGFAMAFLVLLVVRRERDSRLAVPEWLVFLGNASYAIYLVHPAVLPLLVRLPVFAIPSMGLLICAVAATFAGISYHLAIEKPVLGLARRFIRAGGAPFSAS